MKIQISRTILKKVFYNLTQPKRMELRIKKDASIVLTMCFPNLIFYVSAPMYIIFVYLQCLFIEKFRKNCSIYFTVPILLRDQTERNSFEIIKTLQVQKNYIIGPISLICIFSVSFWHAKPPPRIYAYKIIVIKKTYLLILT